MYASYRSYMNPSTVHLIPSQLQIQRCRFSRRPLFRRGIFHLCVVHPTICSFYFDSCGGNQQYQIQSLPALFRRFIFTGSDVDLVSHLKGVHWSI